MSKIKESAILKIVTHPGKAHRDELLAIAIVLASLPAAQMRQVTIERRQPRTEDTLSNGVLVVDVGGGEFDHHQLPPDDPACCALTLVLKDLGLLEQAREVWAWLEFTEIMDAKGPSATASRLGILPDKLGCITSNPVEQWALHWFASNPNSLKDVLVGIGCRLLTELSDYQSAMALLDAHAKIEYVRGVAILDLSFTNDSTAVSKWRAQRCPQARGSIMKDDRGGGYTLYAWQTGGTRWLDFRRIEHLPGIAFAHGAGFLAKTRAGLSFRDVLALVDEALPENPVSCGSFVGVGGSGFSVQGIWRPWSKSLSAEPVLDNAPRHFLMVTHGTAQHGVAEGETGFLTEAALRTAMSHVRNRIDLSIDKQVGQEVVYA